MLSRVTCILGGYMCFLRSSVLSGVRHALGGLDMILGVT